MKQRGNILFLILLAVVLFAALSYAVTQSTRGSSKGMSEENAELLASEIIQKGTLIANEVQRAYLVGGYTQVQMSRNAETLTGTCYSSQNNVSSGACHTIGMLNGGLGLPDPITPDEALAASLSSSWNWVSTRTQAGGVDVGTSLPDEILFVENLRDEVCSAINEALHGDATIPAVAYLADSGGGFTSIVIDGDGTIASPTQTTTNVMFEITYELGCTDNGMIFVLKAN